MPKTLRSAQTEMATLLRQPGRMGTLALAVELQTWGPSTTPFYLFNKVGGVGIADDNNFGNRCPEQKTI